MNVSEIRAMEANEIRENIANLEKDLMHCRMKNAIGTLQNPIQIRHKKRTVARLNTILREHVLKNS